MYRVPKDITLYIYLMGLLVTSLNFTRSWLNQKFIHSSNIRSNSFNSPFLSLFFYKKSLSQNFHIFFRDDRNNKKGSNYIDMTECLSTSKAGTGSEILLVHELTLTPSSIMKPSSMVPLNLPLDTNTGYAWVFWLGCYVFEDHWAFLVFSFFLNY